MIAWRVWYNKKKGILINLPNMGSGVWIEKNEISIKPVMIIRSEMAVIGVNDFVEIKRSFAI